MQTLSPKKKEKNTKVGIWIETPGSSFTVGEGIVRVIGKVVPFWLSEGKEVCVVASKGCELALKNVIRDLGGDANLLKFRTVKEKTLFQRIIGRGKRTQEARKANMISFFVDTAKIYYSLAKYVVFRYRGVRNYPRPEFGLVLKRSLKCGLYCLGIGPVFLQLYLYRRIENSFLCAYDYKKKMLSKALRQNVDVWYVPRPDWHLAAELGPRKVWCFWDYIPLEAPLFFSVDSGLESLRRAVGRGGEVVTMSNYVKDNHCAKALGIPLESIRVKQPPFHLGLTRIDRSLALQNIHEYLKDSFLGGRYNDLSIRYLVDFPFGDVDFIFFPSQLREYKNFNNVVLAVENIIRRSRRPVKLITTGSFDSVGVQKVHKYIVDRGLVFDILSIPNIPSNVLYSFMTLAKVTICPSFCEGGFPLSFMESVSLETPTVVARMPNIKEFCDWDILENREFTFDPSSIDDMSRAILFAMSETDKVLNVQKKIISAKFNYTWQDYASFVLGQA
nr:hypothetical protein BdHM001_14230 [Bdellovibrio sp. HM001]